MLAFNPAKNGPMSALAGLGVYTGYKMFLRTGARVLILCGHPHLFAMKSIGDAANTVPPWGSDCDAADRSQADIFTTFRRLTVVQVVEYLRDIGFFTPFDAHVQQRFRALQCPGAIILAEAHDLNFLRAEMGIGFSASLANLVREIYGGVFLQLCWQSPLADLSLDRSSDTHWASETEEGPSSS